MANLINLSINNLSKKNSIDEICREIEGEIKNNNTQNENTETIDDIIFNAFQEEENYYRKNKNPKKNAVKNSIIGISLGVLVGAATITALITYTNTFVNIQNAPVLNYTQKQYSNAHNKDDPFTIRNNQKTQTGGKTQITKKQTEKNNQKNELHKKYIAITQQKPIPFENDIIPIYENKNTKPSNTKIQSQNLAQSDAKPKTENNTQSPVQTAKIPPIPKEKPKREISGIAIPKPGYFYAEINIRDSLYYTAKENGLPDPVIAEIIRLHSFNVDFQREIQNGDAMQVFYYHPKDKKSHNITPVLIYTSLELKKGNSAYYRFTDAKTGKTAYYDKKGQNASRTFIRTPVDGARISSKFGIRKHPILGYNKMHTGVDFAAPKGTPVRAASNGVIEKIGRNGNYGEYIKIKHKNGQATAYAHLSKYAKGIKKGSKIKQGQIIGYVGSTGRSTGPHLHYEILQNGKPVNPLKVKLVGLGEKLNGEKLQTFNRHKAKIHAFLATIPATTKVAQK